MNTDWQPVIDIMKLSNDSYPVVSYGKNGDVKTTHEQRTALFRKWKQMKTNPETAKAEPSWANFAKTVEPTTAMEGAITVQWYGMWLCIEKDGYVHS